MNRFALFERELRRFIQTCSRCFSIYKRAVYQGWPYLRDKKVYKLIGEKSFPAL